MSYKILFILSGNRNKASSRVRGFWIAEELQKQGISCTLRWDNSRWGIFKLVFKILFHDIIFFQKTYSRYHRWLMVFAKRFGKKTYLDIDDAPSLVKSPITLANFEAMCHMADGVFAGSSSLLAYIRQFQPKSYLIPSSIKLENYSVPERKENGDKVCLGWIGSGKYYKHDLVEVLVEPLRELAQRYRLHLKIVGASEERELEVFKGILGLETELIDGIEWSDPQAVSGAIRDFDIGLYPLLPNEFNYHKCGFKALEYMSMEIPVVASPVANSTDVVVHGQTGYLAASNQEWLVWLGELIGNPARRKEMGLRGREKIEREFDVSVTAKKIIRILYQ